VKTTFPDRPRAVNPDFPTGHDRLIDTNQVAHRLRISKRTLYRRVAAGRVPAPVEQRRGVIAKWRLSDIDAFLAGDRRRGFSLPLLKVREVP
jgi:predicted DNA-binding transcriptional regulator AlpA